MARRATTSGKTHPRSPAIALRIEDLISLARRVTKATDCPVVGGVAVGLHGGGTTTFGIDIYSEDFWATHERLERAGIMWNAERREHLIDGVPVHMVGPESLGRKPTNISTIKGVRVLRLADLITAKLTIGLEHIRRSKDITHVQALIERVRLGKDSAPKLPMHLRAAFKELVDMVHEPRRTPIPPREFWKKYA